MITVKEAKERLDSLPDDAVLVGEGGDGTISFSTDVKLGVAYLWTKQKVHNMSQWMFLEEGEDLEPELRKTARKAVMIGDY